MDVDYTKFLAMIRQRDEDKIEQAQGKEVVNYHEESTLEAGFRRMVELYETYDNVLIAYSGGKDSLVCLELADMALDFLGRSEAKPIVFFRDEELIPDDVIDVVMERAESGDYDFRYYCLEMSVGKYILGKSTKWVSWDHARKDKWVRQPPSYAITDVGVDTAKLEQYDFDNILFEDLVGSRIVVTGVRADESLLRLAACCSGGWLNGPKKKGGVSMAKPIYDWTETDVFKFFFDFDVGYAEIYNNQMWAGVALRVATPLHENAIGNIHKLKAMYPKFYHQIVSMFPEVEAQMRYGKEYDKGNFYDMYPHTYNGMRQYVKENAEGEEAEEKMQYIHRCEVRRLNEPDPVKMHGGFPLKHVFDNLISGGYKKSGQIPLSPVPLEMMEFERGHDLFA